MRPLTRDEVRSIDRRAIDQYGMTGLVLMENAGRGCTDVLMQLGCTGPVAIVCGKGNNAGDGFVIARHLDLRGVAVKVILLAEASELRGDAAANDEIIRRAGLTIIDRSQENDPALLMQDLDRSQWIVDAILGTGTTGAPREPFATAIRAINAANSLRLAIDLPSGLDCDTGEPADPTIRAHHTCTFVAAKTGFSNPAAAPYLGQVHILDIGAPRHLLHSMQLDAP